MNRFLLPALLPAAALPLLVDASFKGLVLLALAAVCVLIMRGASAAARHMVWLAAIVALLLLPLLAALLPGWRVLPEWAEVKPTATPETLTPSALPPDARVIAESPAPVFSETARPPVAPSPSPASGPLMPAGDGVAPVSPAVAAVPVPASRAVLEPATQAGWITTVWMLGCALLLIRLVAAHGMLRRTTRNCVGTADPFLTRSLAEARQECGVRTPVRLLLDERRTIPVVWGIFRPTLLLPADALTWDAAQLRSVLLHELAHIRRRDTAVQALTGIACALHWFNPLVWLAAWRLHMERERACDDLVLARGVRASDYAGHLLHVAAEHTAARWTAVCGLAMARQSSLEGRLLAVLSDKLNRRGLTRTLAAAAILLSAVIAVPVAMLRAAEEKDAGIPGPGADTAPPSPKNETARTEAVERELRKLEAHAGEPEKPRTAPEAAGAIVHVDTRGTFVLIHAAAGVVFTPGQELECSGSAARLRVTRERRNSFFAADVVSGAPARGDAVAPVKDAKTAGLEPQHPAARDLYRNWQSFARTNGDIPGGLIGRLASELKEPADEKLTAILVRMDATRDWKVQEAVTLLDELAPNASTLLSASAASLAADHAQDVWPCQPLPAELQNLPWGQPDAWIGWSNDTPARDGKTSGLRVACVPENPAASYPAGSVIPVRIYFHNAGDVAFQINAGSRVWDQLDDKTARTADGRQIKIAWASCGYMEGKDGGVVRLAPGQYWSMDGGRLIVGDGRCEEQAKQYGAVLLPAPGDKVNVTWVVHTGGFPNSRYVAPRPDWKSMYQKRVRDRVMLEAPLPASAEDRAALVRRARLALTGMPATVEEVREFTADTTPDALEKLITRLQALPPVEGIGGPIKCGEWSFTVTPGPRGDHRGAPAAATSPGIYELSSRAYLRHYGGHANVEFLMPLDAGVTTAPGTYTIELPEVEGKALPHTFIWQHGKDILWLVEKDRVRCFDFTDSYQWKETTPASGRDAIPENLRGVLAQAEQPSPASPPPAAPARATPAGTPEAPSAPIDKKPVPVQVTKLDAALIASLQWGAEVNGLRGALVRPQMLGEAPSTEALDFRLLVQNVSGSAVRVNTAGANENRRHVNIRERGRILSGLGEAEASAADFTLQPQEVAVMALFRPTGPGESVSHGLTPLTFEAEFTIEGAAAPAWNGKLVTADTAALDTAFGAMPKDREAAQLFQVWSAAARRSMHIPGAFIALLGESVDTFVKNNPTWATTPQLVKLRPRLDGSRDWTGPEAIALLNELSALQTTPVSMALETEQLRAVQTGKPLPPDLAGAPWGEANASGLRAAYALEPGGAEHPASSARKARILIHNYGKEPVVFRTRNWHQLHHKATGADGAELPVESIGWTTRGRLLTFRLAPGEFIELRTPGLGIGDERAAKENDEARVGTWIAAKEGDSITVTPAAIPLHDWNEDVKPGGEIKWWPDYIRQRLARDLPLPVTKEERDLMIYRDAIDLFGTPVEDSIRNPFFADQSGAAVENLVKSLAARPGQQATAGDLKPGVLRFKITAPPAESDKKPKSAAVPARNWKVRLLDGDSGKPLARPTQVRVTIFSGDAKSSDRIQNVPEGGELEVPLQPEEYGMIRLVDDKLTEGAVPASYFGNVPDNVSAAVKHRDSGSPFAVKVWPNVKTVLVNPANAALSELSDGKYSAIALQTAADVMFVLVYPGELERGTIQSSGFTSGQAADPRDKDGDVDASRDGPRRPAPGAPAVQRWKGTVKLLGADRKVKRSLPIQYSSDAPNVLVLDGRAYELGRISDYGMGSTTVSGRLVLLRDEGAPVQTDRTLAVRTAGDVTTAGNFAVSDANLLEVHAASERLKQSSGWLLGWDVQNPIQHGDGQRVARLRVFEDGRVLWVNEMNRLTERKMTRAQVQELLRWLATEGGAGEWKPEMVMRNGVEAPRDPVKNMWDRETSLLFFTLAWKRHGLVVESGSAGDTAASAVWEHLRKVVSAAPAVAYREWSPAFRTLATDVAESRGLTDWQMDDLIAWGPEQDGLQSGLLLASRAVLRKQMPVQLVVRNVSAAPRSLQLCLSLNVMEPEVSAADGTRKEVRKVLLTGFDSITPVTLQPGEQREFEGPAVQFGLTNDDAGKPRTPDWPVCGVVTGAGKVRVTFPLSNVHAPSTGAVEVSVTEK